MTEINIYTAALEVLRRDGWCQDFRTNDRGSRCLVGALDAVCGHVVAYDDHLLAPLDKIAEENYADRVSPSSIYPPCVTFNDSGATSFADVEALLEKAAAG